MRLWVLVSLCVAAASPLASAEQSAQQAAPQPGILQFKVGDRDVYLGGQYLDPGQVTPDGYVASNATVTALKEPEFKNPQSGLISIRPSVLLDDANNAVAFSINRVLADGDVTDSQLIQRGRDMAANLAQQNANRAPDQATSIR